MEQIIVAVEGEEEGERKLREAALANKNKDHVHVLKEMSKEKEKIAIEPCCSSAGLVARTIFSKSQKIDGSIVVLSNINDSMRLETSSDLSSNVEDTAPPGNT
ncbi:hypothetical protein AMTR_s00110p00069350 [Amborella trichopoda]|uniref:Uncharacterized protein n=1 Tax=Amborella trichopoda TaxID=13333 RepID=W1NX33_AMBTC|nr:hypothetical protein AMTR_s00110p00069350 [Amborella trichopoda]